MTGTWYVSYKERALTSQWEPSLLLVSCFKNCHLSSVIFIKDAETTVFQPFYVSPFNPLVQHA